jgi:hypothetical protein
MTPAAPAATAATIIGPRSPPGAARRPRVAARPAATTTPRAAGISDRRSRAPSPQLHLGHHRFEGFSVAPRNHRSSRSQEAGPGRLRRWSVSPRRSAQFRPAPSMP